MSKILVVCGHPFLANSTSNLKLLDLIKDRYKEDVTISLLADKYPDWKFDLYAEQELVEEADFIVFQYPLYNFYMPALMKKYIEEVFHYGFAYGPGCRIRKKTILWSITMGIAQQSYDKPYSYFDELLSPLKSLMVMWERREFHDPICTFKTREDLMEDHLIRLDAKLMQLGFIPSALEKKPRTRRKSASVANQK